MNKYVKDYIQGLTGVEIAKKHKTTEYKVYKALTSDKNALIIELYKISDKLNKYIDYSKMRPRDLLNYKLKVIELLLKYGEYERGINEPRIYRIIEAGVKGDDKVES